MAAEDVGSLVVRIEADLRDFQSGINQINNRVETFGSRVKKIGGVIAGAFAVKAIVGFGESMIIAASDAEEMQSKFNTVFGEMSETTEDWAKNFRDAVGGSKVEIKSMLADSADLLAGFGATEQEAFDLSTRMQSLGTDIASFSNIQGGAKEAVDRLRKGLMGETENLKALGIVINQKMLQDELMAMGDNRKLKDLTELEKMELRYTIAVRQSANAIGDAEKTSQSFANQMRNLEGKIHDVTARLGVKLLPVANQFLSWVIDNIPIIESTITNAFDATSESIAWLKDNADILIPVISGLVAALTTMKIIQVINKAIAASRLLYATWQASTFAQTLAQYGLNAALLANPIGLVIIAIGALVAAGVALYMHWDKVKAMASNLWNSLKTTFGNIKNYVFNIANDIKSKLSDMFKFKIPKIKLPHFSIKGKLSLSPPQIPKVGVSWYDKGGIFNSPSVIGVGEKRPEFVGALDDLRYLIGDELNKSSASNGGNININVDNMNVRTDNDIKLIAREFYNLQKQRSRGSGVVFG